MIHASAAHHTALMQSARASKNQIRTSRGAAKGLKSFSGTSGEVNVSFWINISIPCFSVKTSRKEQALVICVYFKHQVKLEDERA